MKQLIVVIYHRADFDGIFCREIARKFYGNGPEVLYVGWDYGDPVPDVPSGAQLVMLDISIEPLMNHPNLVWIDHHKSAIEKYGVMRDIPGYQLDGVAACRLAWQYFFGDHVPPGDVPVDFHPMDFYPALADFHERHVLEPWAVRLAGEYDVWDRRDPDAEVFQFGLRSIDPNPYDWQRLLSVDQHSTRGGSVCEQNQAGSDLVMTLLQNGRTLKRYQDQQNADIVRANWFRTEWEGLTFLCCNHARFNSHLFDAVIPDVVVDALLGFRYDGSKGCWVVSMYHHPDHTQHDLSLIAVRHGGGGHRGACGFTCSTLPFPFPGEPR